MKNQGTTTTEKQEKLSSILEPLVFLAIFGIAFAVLANIMGGANMMNTLMNTAYQLIMDTGNHGTHGSCLPSSCGIWCCPPAEQTSVATDEAPFWSSGCRSFGYTDHVSVR